MESPALRQQRAFSSEANSDYEYYYEQSALGRRKKKSILPLCNRKTQIYRSILREEEDYLQYSSTTNYNSCSPNDYTCTFTSYLK